MKYFVHINTTANDENLAIISAAVISDDGRELQLINSELDVDKLDDFSKNQILPVVEGSPVTLNEMAEEIALFAADCDQFIGYNCAAEYVLFQRIIRPLQRTLPPGFRGVNWFDLAQECDRVGFDPFSVSSADTFDTLDNCRWVRDVYKELTR